VAWRRFTDSFYWRVRSRLAPGLLNSQYAYAAELKPAVTAARRWLDVGCGHAILPSWIGTREAAVEVGGCRAVGVDMDLDALKRHESLAQLVCGNVGVLPFLDNMFSLVTANMVVEHVRHPECLFTEVFRVLAPGGRFIIHTPNLLGYTTALTTAVPRPLRAGLAALLLGRDTRHVYPTFYRANTARSLEKLAAFSGLTLIELRYVESSCQFIAVPPLLLAELTFIRALRWLRADPLRPCLLVMLEKPMGVPTNSVRDYRVHLVHDACEAC
jgi:SAM-dependent methyltransferase